MRNAETQAFITESETAYRARERSAVPVGGVTTQETRRGVFSRSHAILEFLNIRFEYEPV